MGRKSGEGQKNQPLAIDEISVILKENLKTIRQANGLSLDKLATQCGVSRAMLSQIEQGKSKPTISVLWKIASGLNVPFSDLLKEKSETEVCLLKEENAKVLYSNSKVFSSRALFPMTGSRHTEFYELRLTAGGKETADPHPPGTTENIVLVSGTLQVKIQGVSYLLSPKDSIFFKADLSHEYLNPGDQDALMYLVMTYTKEIY
jgi:XRE family transcriptional regulator, regulator of sulfur utilization